MLHFVGVVKSGEKAKEKEVSARIGSKKNSHIQPIVPMPSVPAGMLLHQNAQLNGHCPLS